MRSTKKTDLTKTDGKTFGSKQAARRKLMIDAARDLFRDFGYKPSMNDIAEKAGVGVTTVHNYFGTKEGVFASMLREDVQDVQDRALRKLKTLPEDPVKAVMSVIKIHNKVFQMVQSKLMMQFIWQSKSNGPLREVVDWMVEWQCEHVATCLEHFIEQGVLDPNLDTREAAKIIVNMSIRRNQHYYGNFPGGSKHLKDLEATVGFVVQIKPR